jgi:hypothetical protein
MGTEELIARDLTLDPLNSAPIRRAIGLRLHYARRGMT